MEMLENADRLPGGKSSFPPVHRRVPHSHSAQLLIMRRGCTPCCRRSPACA